MTYPFRDTTSSLPIHQGVLHDIWPHDILFKIRHSNCDRTISRPIRKGSHLFIIYPPAALYDLWCLALT